MLTSVTSRLGEGDPFELLAGNQRVQRPESAASTTSAACLPDHDSLAPNRACTAEQ